MKLSIEQRLVIHSILEAAAQHGSITIEDGGDPCTIQNSRDVNAAMDQLGQAYPQGDTIYINAETGGVIGYLNLDYTVEVKDLVVSYTPDTIIDSMVEIAYATLGANAGSNPNATAADM